MIERIKDFADLVTAVLSGECTGEEEFVLWSDKVVTRSLYQGDEIPDLVIRHASIAALIEAERRSEGLVNRLVDQDESIIVRHILNDDSTVTFKWS